MSKRKKVRVKGAKCPRCKYCQVVADPRGGECTAAPFVERSGQMKKRKLESFNVKVYVDNNGVVTLGHVSKFRLTPKDKESCGIWCRGNKRKLSRLLGIRIHEG